MKDFEESRKLKIKVNSWIKKIPHKDRVHLSIVDVSSGIPLYAGFQDKKFVYPASIYKLYIAGALLNEVKNKKISLQKKIGVSKKNAVDKKKEIKSDKRPLLRSGNRVSVEYLLDLMITRSDNTAANTLIDIVRREKINKFIRKHGWKGSEVTRKFLPRNLEDAKYREVPPTLTTTRHLAEFLYLVETNKLVSPAMSKLLKELLARQLDKSKIGKVIPRQAAFLHKTGWFEFIKDRKKRGVCGDCGIIQLGRKKLIVSCIVTLSGQKGDMLLRGIGRNIVKDL